jgi:hypothetical protein
VWDTHEEERKEKRKKWEVWGYLYLGTREEKQSKSGGSTQP